MKMSVKFVLFVVLAAGSLAEGVKLCCGNPPCIPPVVCNVK